MGWLRRVLTHPATWAVLGIVAGIIVQDKADVWGRVFGPATPPAK